MWQCACFCSCVQQFFFASTHQAAVKGGWLQTTNWIHYAPFIYSTASSFSRTTRVSDIAAITSLQMRAERQHQHTAPDRRRKADQRYPWAFCHSIIGHTPRGNNLWAQFLAHECVRRRMHYAHANQNKALHCPAVRDHLKITTACARLDNFQSIHAIQ